MAGAEGGPGRRGWEVRCVGSSGSGQGVALPARGHGSLSAVVLPALHIHGAELTAPPACSPPETTCWTPCLILMSPATLQRCVLSAGVLAAS